MPVITEDIKYGFFQPMIVNFGYPNNSADMFCNCLVRVPKVTGSSSLNWEQGDGSLHWLSVLTDYQEFKTNGNVKNINNLNIGGLLTTFVMNSFNLGNTSGMFANVDAAIAIRQTNEDRANNYKNMWSNVTNMANLLRDYNGVDFTIEAFNPLNVVDASNAFRDSVNYSLPCYWPQHIFAPGVISSTEVDNWTNTVFNGFPNLTEASDMFHQNAPYIYAEGSVFEDMTGIEFPNPYFSNDWLRAAVPATWFGYENAFFTFNNVFSSVVNGVNMFRNAVVVGSMGAQFKFIGEKIFNAPSLVNGAGIFANTLFLGFNIGLVRDKIFINCPLAVNLSGGFEGVYTSEGFSSLNLQFNTPFLVDGSCFFNNAYINYLSSTNNTIIINFIGDNLQNISKMFNFYTNTTIGRPQINIQEFNFKPVVNAYRAFCASNNLNVAAELNFPNLVNGSDMMRNSLLNKGLDNWEFPNLIDGSSMFNNSFSALGSNSIDGSSFFAPKLENGMYMFDQGSALIFNGGSFNNLVNAECMFNGVGSIQGNWNVNGNNAYALKMFSNIAIVEPAKFNIYAGVTNFTYMFRKCLLTESTYNNISFFIDESIVTPFKVSGVFLRCSSASPINLVPKFLVSNRKLDVIETYSSTVNINWILNGENMSNINRFTSGFYMSNVLVNCEKNLTINTNQDLGYTFRYANISNLTGANSLNIQIGRGGVPSLVPVGTFEKAAFTGINNIVLTVPLDSLGNRFFADINRIPAGDSMNVDVFAIDSAGIVTNTPRLSNVAGNFQQVFCQDGILEQTTYFAVIRPRFFPFLVDTPGSLDNFILTGIPRNLNVQNFFTTKQSSALKIVYLNENIQTSTLNVLNFADPAIGLTQVINVEGMLYNSYCCINDDVSRVNFTFTSAAGLVNFFRGSAFYNSSQSIKNNLTFSFNIISSRGSTGGNFANAFLFQESAAQNTLLIGTSKNIFSDRKNFHNFANFMPNQKLCLQSEIDLSVLATGITFNDFLRNVNIVGSTSRLLLKYNSTPLPSLINQIPTVPYKTNLTNAFAANVRRDATYAPIVINEYLLLVGQEADNVFANQFIQGSWSNNNLFIVIPNAAYSSYSNYKHAFENTTFVNNVVVWGIGNATNVLFGSGAGVAANFYRFFGNANLQGQNSRNILKGMTYMNATGAYENINTWAPCPSISLYKAYFNGMFSDCTTLSDWASIHISWK